MSPSDREYYRERAAAERVRASEASRDDVRLIHAELACLYEALVSIDEEGERPRLRIAS